MIGWLDCSSGVAGDMLLGALVDAGVPLGVLQDAVDAVAPERVELRAEVTQRAGLRATKVHVEGTDSAIHRTWRDIRELLAGSGLDPAVRDRATSVFARLADAEAGVHGTDVDDVHFHEVGALDAIADVVGVCAGLAALALDSLTCSPVALGGGTARAAHGRIPVPAPAVVALLAGAPTYGGPVDVELTTPTGAALLAEHVADFGHQPSMRVATAGTGAGGRDLPGQPNVVRLLAGEPLAGAPATHGSLVLETNVDDLDPRVWPHVLVRLLAVGAADAWLTPVLMKKGRPAHTLHVLVDDETAAAAARRVVFTETSAIGLRETRVRKHALERKTRRVTVDGHDIAVKVAVLDGAVVNAQPEYEDVARAAAALGRPVKEVLARAASLAAPWMSPSR